MSESLMRRSVLSREQGPDILQRDARIPPLIRCKDDTYTVPYALDYTCDNLGNCALWHTVLINTVSLCPKRGFSLTRMSLETEQRVWFADPPSMTSISLPILRVPFHVPAPYNKSEIQLWVSATGSRLLISPASPPSRCHRAQRGL